MSPEFEKKADEACPCTNPVTKGFHLYICGLGHWELSRYSLIKDWSCKECQKLWNTMTPDEIERRTEYRKKIAGPERSFDHVKFMNDVEERKKNIEATRLAKAIAKELRQSEKQ